MTNNRETQRKALDKYFDLIKDKKNRRVAFRGYLTFFPRFFRKDKLALKQERYNQFRKNSENGLTCIIETGMYMYISKTFNTTFFFFCHEI